MAMLPCFVYAISLTLILCGVGVSSGDISVGHVDNLDLGQPAINGQLINRIGYSLIYADKHEQAVWVSYKLTRHELSQKVARRKDNFRKDTEIISGSATKEDYAGSGYDRGHLAPAGDMTWSAQAMSESFLLSNITPQVPSVNRGIWRKLENQVRAWAVEYTEVYVITGPILKPNLFAICGHLRDSDSPGLKIGTNQVEVPRGYYKIIVDFFGPEIKAIAFMVPNRTPGTSHLFYSLKSYATSIDTIEALTNIDFLNKLPENVQEGLESNIQTSQWSTTP
jgi:endonuclease G